jgi:hypothetical protein
MKLNINLLLMHLRAPVRFARYVLLGAFLALGVGAVSPARGQPANPELSRAVDEAFLAMLRDPGNLELTFRFAELATRAGNYEGAISALERMLMIDPNLPRIRLELATLYFRLASYDLARSYLQSALDADPPPEVRARAESFLAEIDKRQSRHKFSGSALFGLRYQTNASSGYRNTSVPIPALAGSDPVDIGSARRDDWNLMTAITAAHSYDFGGPAGDALETNVTLYGTRQNQVKSVRTALIEMNSGPRFSLAETALPGASLRPYGIANVVALQDNRYFHSLGGGLGYQMPLSASVIWSISHEIRIKNYRTDATRRTIRSQNGVENATSTGFIYTLGPDDAISLNATLTRMAARDGYKVSRAHSFGAGYTKRVAAPFGLSHNNEKWTLGPSVGRHITTYVSPDVTVDADTRRGDFEWRYGLMLGVPITESISGVVQGQRQLVGSSYLINKYRNDSLMMGLSWIF